ncbi:tRNA epoxyqueuosine(34) reductase QueG [Maritalea sp.]|uniref:tRNA epoxyqueuosine(34) reductase QueG n=1 Tax=Maritalea sp. TaxID=2003361 RepID=UPI003EFA463D
MLPQTDKILADIKKRAERLGFVHFGVTGADVPDLWGERLQTAIGEQWHGDMHWMAETLDRRISPKTLWPEAKSAIVLAYNYTPDSNPMDLLEQREKGIISAYARNRDYHDIIKGKLKELAGVMARQLQAQVKVFVDTAPLMEKPLAQQAGIGWQGKHSVLVSKDEGCWLFLGTILTDAELAPDEPEQDHCGSCTRCLDICPTNAFPAPYKLDARKCIAYLTNEFKGITPPEFRVPIGNRIYGCDDCLAVCPWNKFAQTTSDAKLQMRDDLRAPDLIELAKLDDAQFRTLFAGSPVKRLGRDAFIRNVLIGLGNASGHDMVLAIKPHLHDANPIVRATAVWALTQHLSATIFAQYRSSALQTETDKDVIAEWNGKAS